MPDREKVIRIIDELIFEAQKEPIWKAENALRCAKKELLKEQESVVHCGDCQHGEKVNSVYLCGKRRGFGIAHDGNWFCADGERRGSE